MSGSLFTLFKELVAREHIELSRAYFNCEISPSSTENS